MEVLALERYLSGLTAVPSGAASARTWPVRLGSRTTRRESCQPASRVGQLNRDNARSNFARRCDKPAVRRLPAFSLLIQASRGSWDEAPGTEGTDVAEDASATDSPLASLRLVK